MNVFKSIQFLRYLLVAKTRHGVQPPFAYDFMEQVLRSPDPWPGLVRKLQDTYADHQVICLDLDPVKTEAIAATADNRSIWVFPDPYRNRKSMRRWQQWKQTAGVRLSIDIFQYGLLVFDPHILHVQHYRLRTFRTHS